MEETELKKCWEDSTKEEVLEKSVGFGASSGITMVGGELLFVVLTERFRASLSEDSKLKSASSFMPVPVPVQSSPRVEVPLSDVRERGNDEHSDDEVELMKQGVFDDSFGMAVEAEEEQPLASILVPSLCSLLLWNSISSTVHTEPLMFSMRMKHLWRLRLCLTAFFQVAALRLK